MNCIHIFISYMKDNIDSGHDHIDVDVYTFQHMVS